MVVAPPRRISERAFRDAIEVSKSNTVASCADCLVLRLSSTVYIMFPSNFVCDPMRLIFQTAQKHNVVESNVFWQNEMKAPSEAECGIGQEYNRVGPCHIFPGHKREVSLSPENAWTSILLLLRVSNDVEGGVLLD